MKKAKNNLNLTEYNFSTTWAAQPLWTFCRPPNCIYNAHFKLKVCVPTLLVELPTLIMSIDLLPVWSIEFQELRDPEIRI